MESTDKLRKLADECYTFNDCSDKLMVIADEIEREIAERYMLLPVDADGVPIRVGDKLRFCDFAVQCAAVSPERIYYWDEYSNGHWVKGVECRHCKSRTIEDVLEEFLIEFDDWDWNTGGNDRDNARKQLFAKYADELRSMGVGE